MKKIMQWVLAATLVCGATVFTSCKSDDDKDPVIENLSEKILGKWMFAERNGEATPTNKKRVFTFVSSTKAYVSASHTFETPEDTKWFDHSEADIAIVGNKVTLTMHPDEHTTMVDEFNITAIDDTKLTAIFKVTVTVDGTVERSSENNIILTKVKADYSEQILGLWECEGISGGETYNDANARLEFLADGTYRYFRQAEGGQWQAVHSREFEDYFVDGTLVATRWKERGEDEQREWWEIKSLSGDEMVWTALRQNDNGTTFQQEVRWKKIDFNLAENIIGKWMTADIVGQTTLTNEKEVITFVSPTKATLSTSRGSFTETSAKWSSHLEYDVEISGNKVTLTGHPKDGITLVQEYNVTAIDDDQMLANFKVTYIRNGEASPGKEHYYRLEKITADYHEAVLGLWECTELTGIETYNDANARLEFFADGTYKYWRKNDAGEWEAVTTREFQDYFVDGTLLATRWKNQGEDELREWWEIASIADGQMVWTALRANADGTTVQQGMKWKKVK
jgi:hypothetical protein